MIQAIIDMAIIARTNAGPPYCIKIPWLAQLFDFASEAAVLGRHIALDVDQPPVDVAQAAADVAGGPGRGLTHALPEALMLLVLDRQLARLVVGDEAGDEIERQDTAAAHEHRADEHDPDQCRVEPGIVGDSRAHAHELAVPLVEIEFGPARRL